MPKHPFFLLFLKLIIAILLPSRILAGEFTRFLWIDITAVKIFVLNEDKEIIYQAPMALPRHNQAVPVKGRVLQVKFGAYWFPPESIREDYLKRTGKVLPEAVKPDDPRNAMGVGKMEVAWHEGIIHPLSRIHGTNDPQSIGKRVSRGCFRLHNEDFKQIATLIKGHQTEVVIQRGAP